MVSGMPTGPSPSCQAVSQFKNRANERRFWLRIEAKSRQIPIVTQPVRLTMPPIMLADFAFALRAAGRGLRFGPVMVWWWGVGRPWLD
jgi:hypothetical protein